MNSVEILTMLDTTGAMLSGHFVLSSGLHSGQYLQCALLLSNPRCASLLCECLARKFAQAKPDLVVGPAYGGIIVAHELARALGVRAVFTERKNGNMQLRRGFTIHKGQRVLIAEDVVTTGKSVKEVIHTTLPFKPTIVGIAALIDRSNKQNPFGKRLFRSVKKINIKTYTAIACPLCRAGIPLVKPGSRV